MDTRELLEKCRAELERQKAVEAAATPGPWRTVWQEDGGYDCMYSQFDVVSNDGKQTVTELDTARYDHAALDPDQWTAQHARHPLAESNANEIVQARDHDRARLEVAEDQLTYAQERWDDLMETVGDDDPGEAMLREMYDGTAHLNIAAKLLGVEVE